MAAFIFVAIPLFLSTAKPVSAINGTLNSIHVPCGLSKAKDNQMKMSAECLNIEIIDRAHIQVSFPKDTDARFLENVPTNLVTFGQMFGGMYVKNSSGDDRWRHVRDTSYIQIDGGSTNIDYNGGALGKYADRFQPYTKADIEEDFNNGHLRLYLSTEPRNKERLNNPNVCLKRIGLKHTSDYKSGEWHCGDNIDEVTDAIVIGVQNVKDITNYNITFTPSADGRTLNNVFPDKADDQVNSWKLCDATAGSWALIDCSNPKDGYTFTGKSADFFIKNTAPVSIRATSPGKKDINFIVAGSDSTSTANNNAAIDSQGNTVDIKDSCENSGSGVLNWIFCALISSLDGAVNSITSLVDSMLSLDATSVADNDNLHLLWSYFRNISSLLLVVVSLVMIIAQSMGKD